MLRLMLLYLLGPLANFDDMIAMAVAGVGQFCADDYIERFNLKGKAVTK